MLVVDMIVGHLSNLAYISLLLLLGGNSRSSKNGPRDQKFVAECQRVRKAERGKSLDTFGEEEE